MMHVRALVVPAACFCFIAGCDLSDPAGTGGAAAPPAPPSTPAASANIRLSAGVALPQSLPDGTAMGFSVDYRFVEGSPSETLKYVWIIQPASGEPTVVPVELESSDTLQTFTKFRPEHGPFQCYLAEESASGEHAPLSDPLSMR